MTDADGCGRALPMRRARGAVVGLVGSGLAVAGHAAGGGHVVGPLVAVVAAGVVLACVVASASRWTQIRLLSALVGAQAGVHAALWLASPTSAVDPRLAGVASSAHASHAAADHGSGLAMLAAHAVATIAAVVLLAALEGLALSVTALLRRVPPVGVVTVPALAVPWSVAAEPARLRSTLVVRRAPRRGPPPAYAC